MNKEQIKVLGSILVFILGIFLCKFTIFQSTIITLLSLIYWEIKHFRLSGKVEEKE